MDHHGRIVKLMGDGALVEFASVVDAVACAVEIQRRSPAQQNLDVPEDSRIVFRIGINLGDVIIDGDDVYGDGVNIAARLEGLSDPGGIVISGTAYDQARNKLDVAFKSLGEQHLKNIAEPVRVYRVLLEQPRERRKPARRRWSMLGRGAGPAGLAAAIGAGALAAGDCPSSGHSCARSALAAGKPSIAVLPFGDLGDNAAAGLFRRRAHRRSHHRSVEDLRAARHRPQLRVRVQGPSPWTSARSPSSWASATCSKAASAVRAIRFASMCSSSTPQQEATSGPSAMTATTPRYSRCRTK